MILEQGITYIEQLTGADITEIKTYFNEIRANIKFHGQYKEKQTFFVSNSYSGWYPGIGTILGEILYVICRKLRPDKVVETGVAGGMSSSYILCALEENNHGQLYSIDLPWGEGISYFSKDEQKQANKKQSGWLIPDYLKSRWYLKLGSSSERLPSLLRQLGQIGIFLHDSEHSYKNMLFEFQVAWDSLSAGGLLLSHNIDMSDAFGDFTRNVGSIGHSYNNMGGMVKL